jgi:hypothetical protein
MKPWTYGHSLRRLARARSFRPQAARCSLQRRVAGLTASLPRLLTASVATRKMLPRFIRDYVMPT